MKKLLAVSVAATAVLAVPATAHAANSQTKGGCPVVRDHVTKTDSGHGSPAEWADLSFNRATTVCGGPKGGYTITVVDNGKLWTRAGAGSPNGTSGVQIDSRVPGRMHGTYSLTATGGQFAPPAHRDTSLSTSEYVKSLFDQGTTVSGGAYTWTYKTCGGETWVDSSTNNDGQDSTAGNITGKACPTKPTPTPAPTSPEPSPSESTPGDGGTTPPAPVPTPVKSDLPVTG